MGMTWQLVRGEILHLLADPGDARCTDASTCWQHLDDGALLIADGRIHTCGPWDQVRAMAPAEAVLTDYSGKLILPGFVDTHVHYPQTDMIASPGKGLLDWLERFAFPQERLFEDPAHAQEVARFFCSEMLRNGTTSALVFGTVHPQSVDALFDVARQRGLRLIAGKVMMDRNCPEFLRDTAQSSYDDSKRLIERWHGQGRLGYAVTPRFVVTSSPAQLEAAACLAREHPEVLVHSHVAENTAEVELVRKTFPQARSYLDVYEQYQLLRAPAVYAHGIYLDDIDRARLAQTGGAIAFCPTSNLFLGSGLFDLARARDAGVQVSLASDVGGGTSFSLLRTLAAAYEVSHLNGYVLPPLRAMYLATLAGAQALHLDASIGNFLPGKEADFIVMDPRATPLMERRMSTASDLDERLFVWMMLGDDRSIHRTHLMGVAQ